MWEAVERKPEVYDMEYLDQIEDLIDRLGKEGIYTLVDAHQEGFARAICGVGIPDFYAREVIGRDASCINPTADKYLQDLYKQIGICSDMSDFGYKANEYGEYEEEDCLKELTAKYSMTKQGLDAYEALFTNYKSLTDKFVAFWDMLSSRFASNPYIIGYDALNDP